MTDVVWPTVFVFANHFFIRLFFNSMIILYDYAKYIVEASVAKQF